MCIAIIPDEYYDEFVRIYEKRFKKKWKQVGSEDSKENKVKLPYYMGSMDKVCYKR